MDIWYPLINNFDIQNLNWYTADNLFLISQQMTHQMKFPQLQHLLDQGKFATREREIKYLSPGTALLFVSGKGEFGGILSITGMLIIKRWQGTGIVYDQVTVEYQPEMDLKSQVITKVSNFQTLAKPVKEKNNQPYDDNQMYGIIITKFIDLGILRIQGQLKAQISILPDNILFIE